MNIILGIEELDRAASSWLGHVVCLAASSFNALLNKRRKEAVGMSWDSTNKLAGMCNMAHPLSRELSSRAT